MFELYIFNKESPLKNGLTYWTTQSSDGDLVGQLSFNLDRFKFKDNSQSVFADFAQELNYHYKENDGLKKYFEGLSSSNINIELVENLHHIIIFDCKNQILKIDSRIQNKFFPVYLFSINYALAREVKPEHDIYKYLFDFLLCFDMKLLGSLYEYLKRDSTSSKNYDAGQHLQKYLEKIILFKENKLILTDEDKLLTTQLFRNRALTGELPFNLELFESISNKYADDAFSGEALIEYYESFQSSFNKDFAKLYYKNLCESLKQIGMNIVAQRGSRVAHEQGPILINAGSIDINEDFEIKIKKIKSSVLQLLSNLKESFSKSLEIADDNELNSLILNININIDSLSYLASLNLAPKARFKKTIFEIETSLEEVINYCNKKTKKSLEENSVINKDKYLNFYETLKAIEKNSLIYTLELRELISSTPKNIKNAVIYVQRPSSRSGHFIPRIVMGQKLYIETDQESHKQRLEAIPYNFVVPEFDLIASGIDSFFENASISIVTDRNSGKPEIKWENAEDLAISLAPGMYQAIKSCKESGKLFHYQLETTLFGPLIELFMVILENEISNIASIERYNVLNNNGINLAKIESFSSVNEVKKNSQIEDLLNSYKQEVLEAAEFVFSYYLLEDKLQEHMITEGINREDAIFELLLNLYDVQRDTASYCIQRRRDENYISNLQENLANSSLDHKEKANFISESLTKNISKAELKSFIKDYIRYPESKARKKFLEANNIARIVISSNKSIKDADFHYNFTVAPSRIDFGTHVVASVTTLMGRMLGADDPEALIQGKEYIDFVSKTKNSIFESSAEAGSVKVIENTCRAIQYSKAISFQGVFHEFNIDGALARSTINARNTKDAGIHIMEYGTMASTGYCITKEPLFILLGLAINTDSILDKIGVDNPKCRNNLKELFQNLLKSREDFNSDLDWQMHVYEELADSAEVQKYLADPDCRWLPNIKSLATLLKYLSDNSQESMMSRSYSQLSSKLIEFSRIINETGIIQRIQIMNEAIKIAKLKHKIKKEYSELKIILNASYKGNVSDERENANQYLMAFLLHQKQYLKNSTVPEIEKLIDHQINNHSIPSEIRVFDPLVDPDVFMSGELKARAERCTEQLITLAFKEALNPETIKACAISYGSNYKNWRVLNKKLLQLSPEAKNSIEAKLDSLGADLKYLETYHKGFFKDPYKAFQGIDIIQLNSDHDELQSILEDMVQLKELMQINNPNSLLVLVDNPQQAKKPFLDYDKSLEWIALGGTVASHLIANEKYSIMANMIEEKSNWAKTVLHKLIMEEKFSEEELALNQDYLKLNEESISGFLKFRSRADLMRDLVLQKYYEAREMSVSINSLNRYKEWLSALARLNSYNDIKEINFNDWLILGGRWLLNGQPQEDIDYVIKLFDNSRHLTKLGLKGFETMKIFVKSSGRLQLEREERIIEKAGSTKEADLLSTNAADSLEFRALQSKQTKLISLRLKEINDLSKRISESHKGNENIESLWDSSLQEYLNAIKKEDSELAVKIFARLLICIELYAKELSDFSADLTNIVRDFTRVKEADEWSLIPIFGDHRKHGGVFQILANNAKRSPLEEKALAQVSKLGEMFIASYLIFLTININDENELINKLSMFFDQYLNVHEEDYPPYMFHSLCAGTSYGFSQTYYMDTNLRAKMFKLACKSGIGVYKILHYLISNKSILKDSSQEYKDALIGDYENGIIPLNYQHETICIEERLWDCMRALRNFVRNFHDRHPLPIIIKGSDATVEKLFRYKVDKEVELVWIAGLSNPGKHSWDLNCVFRSPLLREMTLIEEHTGQPYINISIFTPYLTNEGKIKQIYTSFDPEIISVQNIKHLAPAQGIMLNNEGFVHAVVLLNGKLPSPSITMSAHTHSQYINNFTRDLGIPEVWSLLSMQQMYAKTELTKLLSEINMKGLAQIEFFYREFDTLEEIDNALTERLTQNNFDHIDFWILKASKDSGGRGISGKMNIHKDREKIIDFIFQKTRSDDLVMQEFVPNNARAFINPDFAIKIEDSFIEAGIAIDKITPYEQIYFAMRSFQSMGGIRGYLFSANIGSVTVNAGQGAKMFYGEPIHIMPIYIAGKIQKLLDEQGEMILKEAIPRHAERFARANDISVRENNIGSTNAFMLNGLFDYIPYLYVIREDKNGLDKEFTIVCEDNSLGGLDFYYSYYGKKINLAQGKDHKESLIILENLLKDSANQEWKGPEKTIDIELAKIEFNSGLGQANLLQKAIEEMVPQNRDLFLEWTEDLGAFGILSVLAQKTKH
jgi:hypothetical protein